MHIFYGCNSHIHRIYVSKPKLFEVILASFGLQRQLRTGLLLSAVRSILKGNRPGDRQVSFLDPEPTLQTLSDSVGQCSISLCLQDPLDMPIIVSNLLCGIATLVTNMLLSHVISLK